MGLNDISYSQILQIKKGDNFELSNLYIKYSSYVNTERNINFKYIEDMLFKKMFKREFKKFIDETNFVEIKDIYTFIRSNIKNICFNGVKNYIECDNYYGLKEFISKTNGSKLNALKALFSAIGFNGTQEDIKSILESDEALYLEIKQNVDSNMPINTYGEIVKMFFAVYLGDKTNIIAQVVTSKEKSEKEEKEAIAKVMESEKILKERKALDRLDERTIDLYKYFNRRYSFKDLDSNINLLPNKKDIELVYKCCGLLLDGKSYSEKSRKEFKDFKDRVLPLLSEMLRKNASTKIAAIDLLFVLENKYTIKEVIRAIDSLSKSVKDNIYLVCGDKLNGITKNMILEDDISYFWNTSLVILKDCLFTDSLSVKEEVKSVENKVDDKNIDTSTKELSRKYSINLYEHYDKKYTKGQLRAAVLMFPSDIANVIFKKYGPLLDGVGTEQITVLENEMLRSKSVLMTVRSRLERIAKNDKQEFIPGKTIMSLFTDEYSHEDIINCFNELKGLNFHTIISDICGVDLGVVPNDLDDVKYYELTYAVSEFRRMLSRAYGGVVKISKGKKSMSSLFNYFDEYSEDEVLKAFDILEDEIKKLFYKKCGPLLNGVNASKVSTDDNKKILLGISRMKTRLRKNRNPIDNRHFKKVTLQPINLMDKLNNEYTFEELCKYISMMTQYRQENIYYVCGKNLDGVIDYELNANDKKIFRSSIQLLRDLISKVKEEPDYTKKRGKDRSDLYSYFDHRYSFEILKSVVESLSDEYKKIIYKKCGPTFNGCNTTPLTEDESYHLQSYIFSSLRIKLERKYKEKLLLDNNYDYETDSEKLLDEFGIDGHLLGEYNKEQLLEALNLLDINDKNVICRLYGEELDSFDISSLSYNDRLIFVDSAFNNFVSSLKSLFNGCKMRKYKFTNLMEYFENHYTKEQIDTVVSRLDESERNLIIRRFGINYDGVGTERISSSENKLLMNTIISRVNTELSKTFNVRYHKKRKNVKDSVRIISKEELVAEEEAKKAALPKISVKVLPKGNTSYIPDSTKINKKADVVEESHEIVEVDLEDFVKSNEVISVEEVIKEQAIVKEEPVVAESVSYSYVESSTRPLSMKEILEQRKMISDSIEEVPMNNILTKKDCVEIKEIIESIDFAVLESYGFTLEEQIVLALIHKKYNGKQDSILKIANFLETDVSIVREVARTAIIKYKDITNKELNNRIVSLKLED